MCPLWVDNCSEKVNGPEYRNEGDLRAGMEYNSERNGI